MTDGPAMLGEQLALEMLSSYDHDIHRTMDALCELEPTQQRADAIAALIRWIEKNCGVGETLPTLRNLLAESWVEEFERRGGQWSLRAVLDADSENGRLVLKTTIPDSVDDTDLEKLLELKKLLRVEEVGAAVIRHLVARGEGNIIGT